MTDQAALLAAILADPADDTARLVYADWLDENAGEVECGACKGDTHHRVELVGKVHRCVRPDTCADCSGTGRVSNGFAERAEFVRVQVELVGKDADPKCYGRHEQFIDPVPVDDIFKAPETLLIRYRRCDRCYPDLRRRERELLENHIVLGRPWETVVERSGQIVVLVGCDSVGHIFRRGFVAEVSCSWSWWLDQHSSILACQPIERVKNTTEPPPAERAQFQYVIPGDGFRDVRWPHIAFELSSVLGVNPITELVNSTLGELHRMRFTDIANDAHVHRATRDMLSRAR